MVGPIIMSPVFRLWNCTTPSVVQLEAKFHLYLRYAFSVFVYPLGFTCTSPFTLSTRIRSLKLANRLLQDVTGSMIVEYTFVFPLFVMMVLGTVESPTCWFEWQLGAARLLTLVRARPCLRPGCPNCYHWHSLT